MWEAEFSIFNQKDPAKSFRIRKHLFEEDDHRDIFENRIKASERALRLQRQFAKTLKDPEKIDRHISLIWTEDFRGMPL